MAHDIGRPAKQKKYEGDALGTRQNILEVATAEFADLGLSGGRVDAIAERTKTSKRMIYYHFGSKHGLYLAVLERPYEGVRNVEDDLRLSELAPERPCESRFDSDEANPDFIRLVSIENIYRAKHMARSLEIARLNAPIIHNLRQVLARSQQSGALRSDIDAIDLPMFISALCFFRVANRYTFDAIFGRDLAESETRRRHRALIGDAVLTYLKQP
jgi:AcrR family transcriptional regulator